MRKWRFYDYGVKWNIADWEIDNIYARKIIIAEIKAT